MGRGLFLDRDGVLNFKSESYVTGVDELVLLPDVGRHLRKFQECGFQLFVITNQSAINRGLLSRETLNKIHQKLLRQLSADGVTVKKIYYCPHRPEEKCACRKPKNALFEKALRDNSLDPSQSWMIGDSDSDIEAAIASGINPFKIKTNSSLLACVEKIING